MFQSTHPHGVRLPANQRNAVQALFQSTHPHGVRLDLVATSRCIDKFQSTHPHGVRQVVPVQGPQPLHVSIHAPTRGATHTWLTQGGGCKVSIHAPTRGATSLWFYKTKAHTFQSTHPHGVRPLQTQKLLKVRCFNPRTHTGCDMRVL